MAPASGEGDLGAFRGLQWRIRGLIQYFGRMVWVFRCRGGGILVFSWCCECPWRVSVTIAAVGYSKSLPIPASALAHSLMVKV
jgi:hypothetical protein